MYYMEYKGDDGFKELMDRGGCNDISVLASYVMEFLSKGYFKPDSINVPIKPVGCSTLTVKTPEDGVMMARNFDYPYGTALIMHTVPDCCKGTENQGEIDKNKRRNRRLV